MKTNTWLLEHAKNVHSQRGEDGVIQKVLEVIGERGGKNAWCVEFGAWDGKHLSNTHHLMEQGWSGVFVEGSTERYQDLVRTYEGNASAHNVCRFVDFEGENTLDNILAETPIPKDFTLLSVDIDGNDYHIWDSLKAYKPKVVVIEYNPAIPPDVEFIQPKDMSVNQGNALLSVVKLGKEKGYELVSVTSLNAIFVKKEFFSKFEIADNSPETMMVDRRCIMQTFQLYDGTLMFTGAQKMMWHGIPLKRYQPIPRFFRVFPSVMGPAKLWLFRVYRRFVWWLSR